MDIEFNNIGRMRWKRCLKHTGNLRYLFRLKGEKEQLIAEKTEDM